MKWIESAGGRVVPIRHDADLQELDIIFESINGLVITGGDLTDQKNLDWNTDS